MTFKCDCSGHIIKIEDINLKGTEGLSFEIYDLYSEKGRKLQKPRLLGDVVIMNNKYPKEYDKLIKFIDKYYQKQTEKRIKPWKEPKKTLKEELKKLKTEPVWKGEGYQPIKGKLNSSNMPKGGSGVSKIKSENVGLFKPRTNEDIPMKWYKIIREDGRIEYTCEHGVGHGNHVHGCCGYSCCMRKDFPLNKGKK